MSIPHVGRFVVAIFIGLLLVPRIADACGVWHMTDTEKKVDVEWLINSGRVNRPKPNAKPDDERTTITLASLYLDTENKSGLRVVRDRKVIFDVVGGKLRKLGKVIATIEPGKTSADKDAIKFGGSVYTIEWTDAPKLHDMPAWKITVKRGDTVVIEAPNAWAMCAGAESLAKTGQMMPDADQMTEIRTRIAFYLAWREVGDK